MNNDGRRQLAQFLAARLWLFPSLCLFLVVTLASTAAMAATPEYVVVGDEYEIRVLDHGEDLEEIGQIQSQPRIRSVALDADRGWVWVVDEDRYLSRYDLAGEEIERLQLSSPFRFRSDDGADGELDLGGGVWEWLIRLFWHLFNPSDILYAETVVEASSGDLIVAAHRAVWRISPNEGQTWRVRMDYNTRGLALDADIDRLWVATRHDAIALDAESGSQHLTIELGPIPRVNELFFDSQAGHLRVHHHHHVLDFDRDGDELNRLHIGPSHVLTPADNGALWLARPGRRLLMLDREGEQLRSLRVPPRVWPVRYLATRADSAGLWIMARRDLGYLASEADAADWLLRQHRPAHLRVAAPRRFDGALLLTAPDALEIVGPRPTVQVQVEGNSRLLDEGSLALLVDGDPVEAGCDLSPADGEGSCTAEQDLSEWRPALAVRVQDVAGNIVETDAVTVRLDSDQDGVPDEEDVYPHDPERSRLAPVSGLSAAVDEAGVHLQWDEHSDPDNTAGYILYRTPAGGGEEDRVRLNELLLESPSWTDEEAEFATGYYYEVVAESVLETPGKPADALAVAVVFNHIPVEAFTAQREGIDARLAWAESDTVDAFRIHRRQGDEDDYQQWSETDTTTWLDAEAHWSVVWHYQVSTLRYFEDPFAEPGEDEATLTLAGPRSETRVVDALPPLSVTLPDAVPGNDGTLEQLVLDDPGTVIVNYHHAAGPVTLQAVSTDGQEYSQSASNGSLALALPAEATRHWHFTLVETLAPDRQAEAELRVLADTTAPNVAIETRLEEPTRQETLEIRGQASDDLSGVASVRLYSEHYPDNGFGTALSDDGQFAGEMPLEPGENRIEARAVDRAGNEGMAAIEVIRIGLPELTIDTPQDGQITEESEILVRGHIDSLMEAEELRIRVNEQTQYPGTGTPESGYPFEFPAVPLELGENRLRISVETDLGTVAETRWVTREQGEPPDDVPPPELAVVSPPEGSTLSATDFVLSGVVSTETKVLQVTVNGENATITGRGAGERFRHDVLLQACDGGEHVIPVVAIDEYERETEVNHRVYCDNTGPEISLESPSLQPWPEVNDINTRELRLQGRVVDSQLTGFTINGSNVPLEPAAGEGAYRFDAVLTLPREGSMAVALEAWDLAGNRATQHYEVASSSPLELEVLRPADGDERIFDGDSAAVEVVVRVDRVLEGMTVRAALDGEDEVPFTLTGGVGREFLTTDTRGERTLTVTVTDENGQPLTDAQRTITLTHVSDVPVEVLRTEPTGEALGVRPDQGVTVYFNRPLAEDKLEIELLETAYGEDYDLSGQTGASLGDAPAPGTVQLNRHRELVPGRLESYPVTRFYTFRPDRRLAYGGQVEVSVHYDGERLHRFRFQTAPPPTLIQGMVVDSDGQGVGNLAVRFPDYGITLETDEQGNFLVGADSQREAALPGGPTSVEINAGLDDPAYGSIHRDIHIQQSRLNELPLFRLRRLDPSVPFVRMRGGARQWSGDRTLSLDLENAALSFPEGRSSGRVHMSRDASGQAPGLPWLGIPPNWTYLAAPTGIAVEGEVNLWMEAPSLEGSHAYLPDTGTPALVLAYQPDVGGLYPAGVARVYGRELQTVRPVALTRLDAIGVLLLDEAGEAVLEEYANEDIGTIGTLVQRLEALYGN